MSAAVANVPSSVAAVTDGIYAPPAPAVMSASAEADGKSLVESLLNDLRTLSTEARKKYNHVKEAAETALVKIRNISTASQPETLVTNMRNACAEILHPLVLGCSTHNPRLVQISLQTVQRMLQFLMIDTGSASTLVNELWQLTEAECEELRVLQTITPLVSADEWLVRDWSLARCVVLTIKLNFSKDPSVINAASASVRQLFSAVFERVVQEDGMQAKGPGAPSRAADGGGSSNKLAVAPPTLRPAAADAYLLLKDLIALIRREEPQWLVGVKRIATNLALELLESAIKHYPSIFFKHAEFSDLLKREICPLVVKLFAGENDARIINQRLAADPLECAARTAAATLHAQPQYANGVSSPANFPLMMRSLRISLVMVVNYHPLLTATQSELLVSFMLDLLSAPLTTSLQWQSAMALEVLHRLVMQPPLLAWMCENYDCHYASDSMTKLLQMTVRRLADFAKRALEEGASAADPGDDMPTLHGEGSPGKGDSGVSVRPGFNHNGRLIPLCDATTLSKKWMLLEWLEKSLPAAIPDGYCLSLAYICLVDCTRSVFTSANSPPSSSEKSNASKIPKQLLLSTYAPLLDGLSKLLDCSADETISDSLLNCLSTLVALSCRLEVGEAKTAALTTVCRACFPYSYFSRHVEPSLPHAAANTANNQGHSTSESAAAPESSREPSQVVAMGYPCPTPSSPTSTNSTVVLTAKNMQVAKVLIASAQANGQQLASCWDVVLASLQHLIWILGMRPTSSGSFRAGGELGADRGGEAATAGGTSANTTVLTTAMSGELPELDAALSLLFESTASLDDVALHHVIAALCRLSAEAMTVAQASSSKEPSFFSIAKLLQTATVNLHRLVVFWKPVTAHLLEVCAHGNGKLRKWGTLALTSLIRNAIKHPSSSDAQRDLAVLTPLSRMSELDYVDVRSKQLDCLMRILQSEEDVGLRLDQQLWPLVIGIVDAIVERHEGGGGTQHTPPAQLHTPNGNTSSELQLGGGEQSQLLVEQGYQAVSLVVREFLASLPFESVLMLIAVDAKYGKQQSHLNVALAAVGQLWDIADFVRRNSTQRSAKELERLWLDLYASLAALCTDARPPVRKSAGDTLLQTVAAHGHALPAATWDQMLWQILFPMLNSVREKTLAASTQPSSSRGGAGASFGAANIMVHHSRDTESKQWAETTVKTLSGVVKIFNSQRATLASLASFPKSWTTLLNFIELIAACDSAEMSLAALKNFHELLFGRQPTASTLGDTAGSKKTAAEAGVDEGGGVAPQLPEKLWHASWRCWLRVAGVIVSPTLSTADNAHTKQPPRCTSTTDLGAKHYVPGPFHLTTLLSTFTPLLKRVHRNVEVDELRGEQLPRILREVVAMSPPAEQMPFAMSAQNSELSPVQESVLECLQAVVKEQLMMDSPLRPVLPDSLKLLLEFSTYAIRPPTSSFQAVATQTPSSRSSSASNLTSRARTAAGEPVALPKWMEQSLIAFAELCTRATVDTYAKSASYPEVLKEAVLVDAIKVLSEPLALKYRCPAQSTWKLAATSLISVCRVGLPLARQHHQSFAQMWPCLADAIEGFLFSRSRSMEPLSAEERKRHEYVDCLMIELVRTEVLPYAALLPHDFMQRVIDILNRGSINTSDHTDVMDSIQVRTDLSRVCFDALLSMSKGGGGADGGPDLVPSGGGTMAMASSSLGDSAISSLLSRCRQVLNDYARDETSSGHFRLPQERIFETISVLRAISTLIDGLAKHHQQQRGAAGSASGVHSPLYAHLVGVYPSLVQLIPSCRGDQQVELALMTALNSYQTLLLMNIHTTS